jgi:preprotein translocase subunit SecG
MWLYYVLSDQSVSAIEAWLTFSFFWIMLIMAFIADKLNRNASKAALDKKYGEQAKLEETDKSVEGLVAPPTKQKTAKQAATEPQDYKAIDVYNALIKDDLGEFPNATDK